MDQNSSNPSFPVAVARKLRKVRQRKIFVQLLSATIAAVAVLLAAMGVAMLIDWLATLYDWRWRAVLTTTALATAGLTVVGWLWVVWRRGLRWERLAHDVDQQLPQMEQRWTTMTRLGPHAADPNIVHPAMLRRVAWESTKWEPHVDPNQVVSTSTLGRAMLGLTLIAATLGIAVLLDSHRMSVLVRRFWWPGAAISATELVGTPGNLVVGKGEPVELTAAIKGSPVGKAVLFMQSEPEATQVVDLVASGEDPIEFMHRVRAVEAPFNYLFRAGDGQTDWFHVDVAERPEIAEVRLNVTPPEYTGRSATRLTALPRRLAAMQTSQLELAIRPTVPLTSLQLRMGDDSLVEMTADAEGWYRWTTQLDQTFTFSPLLTEVRGLTNRRVTKTQVSVFPDKAPIVNITSPSDQVAVRPDDTLQVHFTAQDDNGIGQAEMIVYADTDDAVGQTPLLSIPIPLEDQMGARKIEGIVDLDLSKLEVTDGTRLSYEIRVSESRDGQANAAAANLPKANVMPVRGALSGETAVAKATPATNKADTATTAATTPAETNPGQSTTNPSTASTAANPSAAVAQANANPTQNTPASPSSVASQTSQNGSPSSAASQGDQGNQAEAAMPNSTAQTGANGQQPTTPAADSVAANDGKAGTPDEARTASSGRQSMSTTMPLENPADAAATANANSAAQNGNADMASASPSAQNPAQSPDSASQAAAGQQSGNNSQSQNSMASASPSSPSSSGSTPPPNEMTRRSLDVPAQAASSQRMRIEVDQWAGSFEGQQRQKLEMAIAPELDALDKALARAELSSRTVLDEIDANGEWRGKHDRDMTNAERSTTDAQHVIRSLQQKTENTPYAFIGLQLVDIGAAHVGPAKQNFWTSLQSEGDARVSAARDGWQHVVRARQMIAELEGQYERARREFELAEKLQQVKKMYQVFIENSFGLINPDPGSPSRYNRDIAEFNLDEEYLKRLQEVLEMRREMMAELARILAEDPRLLQRYMDLFRNRAANLREDLADLVAEQNDLNREVMAWSRSKEEDLARISQILFQRHLHGANDLAVDAGRLQDRYQTWLPLNRQTKDADLEAATKLIQAMATTANELSTKATSYDAEMRRAKLKPATTASLAAGESAEAAAAAAQPAWDAEKAFADVRGQADVFAARLRELDVMLRQMGAREDDAEIAVFAANRLVEARRLIAETTAWIRQTDEHRSGNYPRAAEVEQYRLAEETERLAGRLGDIEQTLSGLLQRRDGQLPEAIAEKARVFFEALDKQASPNQLAAVYALRATQMPRVLERQASAHQGLVAAEKAYDEMIQLAIAELDKLPVQDPIASLLEDPTLDELLAALEQELPLAELLGIPNRPSNVQIIADWMRPGNGGGGGIGQGMLGNQIRMRGQRARNRLDRSLKDAVARALEESKKRQAIQTAMPGADIKWNTLVSELDDELQQGRDKAPPEQYRRAISQYFNEISRAAAEKSEQQ
jgi:hypothetical protein